MEYLQYTPVKWDKAFASERDNLLFCIPNIKINVEHIGATSVPNCRSFRNVDILVSVHNFVDISIVAMLLLSKEYREIKEMSTIDCVVLVKKQKVYGCGITVRVVEYASMIYRRIMAFKQILRSSFDRAIKYNQFRETLFERHHTDVTKYNEAKYDYINSLIDERYKFE